MKRVLLFLGTNLAIIVVASITMSILGVGSFLDETGTNLDLQALLIFCFIFGMAGSFISLLLSKKIAKWTMKVHIIDKPRNSSEEWLFRTIEKQSKEAGIGMPEVGIFQAQQANAFATGAKKIKHWWPSAAECSSGSTGMKLKRFSATKLATLPTEI